MIKATMAIIVSIMLLTVIFTPMAVNAGELDPEWGDAGTNTAVCTASGSQILPDMVPDGQGGTIMAWMDMRSGNYDIYAQRLSADGTPQWAIDGIAICTESDAQSYPRIAPDGQGGAIISWQDYDGGFNNIIAQRVDAAGTPLWAVNGVSVCSAPWRQIEQIIIPDGQGGAILAWMDERAVMNDWEIYAQRISASGIALWAVDGVMASVTVPGAAQVPVLVPDGQGGAIISWSSADNIYAQRVDATGSLSWAAPTIVTSAAGTQTQPSIVPDGEGGAIVTWQDERSGNWDVYAQRLNSIGTPLWTVDGIAVCDAINSQTNPRAVPDGQGGAVIAWQDFRSSMDDDVYAQRIRSNGMAMWSANGLAVCKVFGNQQWVRLLPDGLGGAVIAWKDYRGSPNDIYAQYVTGEGILLWEPTGLVVSYASGSEANLVMCGESSWSTGNQETQVAAGNWANSRKGIILAWDRDDNIYAQAIREDYTGRVAETYGLHPDWGASDTNIQVNADPQMGMGSEMGIVPDGEGGAFVIWEKIITPQRIFAQRLNSSGQSQWVANGTLISPGAADTWTHMDPKAVPDGQGGFIVTWMRTDGSESDIMAQRVDRNGNLLWNAPDGLQIAGASTIADLDCPEIISDGQGGAIIAWWNYTGTYTIQAQRVSSAGTILWTPGGVTVSSSATQYWSDTLGKHIVPDGQGGAIVVWLYRDGSFVMQVRAMRINSIGANVWAGANGLAITTSMVSNDNPTIVSNGQGGAVIVWEDNRNWNNSLSKEIYAQHVTVSGTLLWPVNGIPVVSRAGTQYRPEAISDGAGGAIITWVDITLADGKVFAQRVNSTGQKKWATAGVQLCTNSGSQFDVMLVPDGMGGAIVCWEDQRLGFANPGIYAQHIGPSGDLRWGSSALAVATANGGQTVPVMTSDFNGGAILAWPDGRSGSYNLAYASRITTSLERLALVPHAPIRINSNADFDAAHGVSGGSGDAIDPWIIEDLAINGTGYGYCIYVGNTTEHFVIRNSILHNATGAYNPPMYPQAGIVFYNVQGGSVINCTLASSYMGAYLYTSNGNTIDNVTAISNSFGIQLESSNSNNVTGNTAFSGVIGIGLDSSDGNRIAGNNASGNEYGIYLFSSSGNTVANNTASQNIEHGIYLHSFSHWNTVSGNTVSSNSVNGINIILSANITVTNNTVLDNGYGIYLNSNTNTIQGNTVSGNSEGILLYSSSNNIVANNTAESNSNTGIRLLFSSTFNIIRNNTLHINSVGVSLGTESLNNMLYHNRFLANGMQASDETAGANDWDNGYPSGGNYWSDYSGVDVKSGPAQNQPVADNIGDTPYSIDADSMDNYPLWTPAGIDYVVIVDGPNGTDGPSPSDATVGFNFTVDVWAAGYNSTLGYVMDVIANWSVTNSLGATSTITNATGYSTAFNSGATEGFTVLMAEWNGTTDQVNATIASFQPDIIIDGTGNNTYENPPTAAQQIHKWVAPAGSVSYAITLQNDGNATDNIAFVWDISALPAGWTASMFNEDTGTDITFDMNDDGMSWFVNMTKGSSANLTLTIHADAASPVGTYATVGLGFFSTSSNTNDSFGVSAIIPGVDYITLTDSPNGTALGIVNMASLGTVTAYASSYNDTWGYLGLVQADWSCTPVLGTFTNATGTSSIFTAGWNGGWANITGTSGTLTDSFAIFFNGDVTDPVSACNVTGAYWRISLPLTITATASDTESGLAQVRLWYAYSTDNVTFGSYQIGGTDFLAPWSFSFDFPMGEGYYRFYSQAIDNVGNPEAASAVPDVEYGYDATPPATQVSALPSSFDNVSGIVINVTGSDLISGIANATLWYRFNGGTWTMAGFDITAPYQFNFAWPDGDGTYEFHSRARDTAGNLEAAPAGNDTWTILSVDDEGPQTTLWIQQPNFTSGTTVFISPTTEIYLTASDTGSLVASTWYRVWSGTWAAWTQFTDNFTLDGQDRTLFIEYNSTDSAGNHEAVKNGTFILDGTAPSVTLTVSGYDMGAGLVAIRASAGINISASDELSGVRQIFYSIDSGAWTIYSGDFTIVTPGYHNVSFYALDNLGLNSTSFTRAILVDEAPPSIISAMAGPSHGLNPVYVVSNTFIYLNSTDSGSGVASVQYRLNGGSWQNYTGPLNFSTPGAMLLEYRAIDNVGNTGAIQEIELFVDESPPVPGQSITGPSHASLDGTWYVTSQANISLLADDTGSGVAEIWYSLDNGTWTLFTAAFDLTPGAHDIRYYAVDNLGHASTVISLSLFHDDLPPEIYFLGPSPDNGVIRIESGGMVSISATDTGVGVEAIYYSLDGGVTWVEYSELITFTESGTLMCRAIDVLGNIGEVTVTVEVASIDDDDGGNWWWIIIIIIVVLVVALFLFKKSQARAKVSEEDVNGPEMNESSKTVPGVGVVVKNNNPKGGGSPDDSRDPDDDGDDVPTDAAKVTPGQHGSTRDYIPQSNKTSGVAAASGGGLEAGESGDSAAEGKIPSSHGDDAGTAKEITDKMPPIKK